MKLEFTEEQLDSVILHKISKLLINNDLEKIAQDRIDTIYRHVDFTYKARLDSLEHKMESLSRNMDALYLMINK